MLASHDDIAAATSTLVVNYINQEKPLFNFITQIRNFAGVTAIIVACVSLASCGSIAQEVRSSLSNSQLDKLVGKPYADVVYEHPDFGKLVGREKTSGAFVIMKHVGDFGAESSDVGGIYGKKILTARVIYFKVDKGGIVRDWATEFYQSGKQTCWVGFCGGAESKQVPVEEFDRIVRTSKGETIAAWH